MDSQATSKHMQRLIAHTLRWGVGIACALATIGGIIYLIRHGSEPIPDYSQFSYDALPADAPTYTTLSGILHGFCTLNATSWIQTGVIFLLLTPVMRVLLSFFDFLRQRDWLYVAITAAVLAVITTNSISLML